MCSPAFPPVLSDTFNHPADPQKLLSYWLPPWSISQPAAQSSVSPQLGPSDNSHSTFPRWQQWHHRSALPNFGASWDDARITYEGVERITPTGLIPGFEFPSSPPDTCSSPLTDTSVSSSPSHVVCNAPLVAPIPLPYHSPTFLQFELPDIDQDLSHPPYTRRVSKRKRDKDDGYDTLTASSKRSLLSSPRLLSRHERSSRNLGPRRVTHCRTSR